MLKWKATLWLKYYQPFLEMINGLGFIILTFWSYRKVPNFPITKKFPVRFVFHFTQMHKLTVK